MSYYNPTISTDNLYRVQIASATSCYSMIFRGSDSSVLVHCPSATVLIYQVTSLGEVKSFIRQTVVPGFNVQSIDLDPLDDTLYVAGIAASKGQVSKFDRNGTLLWSYRVGDGSTVFTGVGHGAVSALGRSVFAGGYTSSTLPGSPMSNQGGQDWFVALFSSNNGTSVYVNSFGYSQSDVIQTVAVSPDGTGLFTTGHVDTGVGYKYTGFVNAHSTVNGSLVN